MLAMHSIIYKSYGRCEWRGEGKHGRGMRVQGNDNHEVWKTQGRRTSSGSEDQAVCVIKRFLETGRS